MNREKGWHKERQKERKVIYCSCVTTRGHLYWSETVFKGNKTTHQYIDTHEENYILYYLFIISAVFTQEKPLI